jgi:hypothetical protein
MGEMSLIIQNYERKTTSITQELSGRTIEYEKRVEKYEIRIAEYENRIAVLSQ